MCNPIIGGRPIRGEAPLNPRPSHRLGPGQAPLAAGGPPLDRWSVLVLEPTEATGLT
jgi:hypothetical protein